MAKRQTQPHPDKSKRVEIGKIQAMAKRSLLPCEWKQYSRVAAIPPYASKIIRHYCAVRLQQVQQMMHLCQQKLSRKQDAVWKKYWTNTHRYYATLQDFLLGIVGGKCNQVNIATHRQALDLISQLDGE